MPCLKRQLFSDTVSYSPVHLVMITDLRISCVKMVAYLIVTSTDTESSALVS